MEVGKLAVGLLMILAGLALGIYVGLWLCLVGGIHAIFSQTHATGGADVLVVVWGTVRVILSLFLWRLVAWPLVAVGTAIAVES